MSTHTESSAHAFSCDDLEQIQALAKHMDHTAPLPTDADKRLHVDVLIYDGVGELSVVIEDYNDSRDPLIFFPNQAAEETSS